MPPSPPPSPRQSMSLSKSLSKSPPKSPSMSMSIEEIVLGCVYTYAPDEPPRRIAPVHRRPNEVLGEVLLELLRRGPMAIAFSGGVDSSGLLCLATTVARAHGLDEPIAVTGRFPAAPSTDESRWQELVVDHLGLRDWVKVALHDECDIIGGDAQAGLLRHGVRWPPLVHAEQPLMRACGAHTYVMGNGGDELTFPTRAGVLQLVASGTVRRDRAALTALASEVAPRFDWLPGRDERLLPDWIVPAARARLGATVSGRRHRRRFRWVPTLGDRTNAPWARRGHATVVASGADAGVVVAQPLTDPRVVGAMATAGGRWGFPDRATAALALFGESMPLEVARRVDKVDFTDAYFTGPSRTFIESWDGTGVPTELVDAELLATHWRSPRPRYSSIPLLQHAWLAQQGSRS